MDLFELDNFKIKPTPQALTIGAFKALWDRDKSKGKKRAIEEFAYVYFVADYKSVYSSYAKGEKEGEVIKDIITIPNWKPDKLVAEAIERYEELQQTPSMRLLQSVRNSIRKLEEYFDEVDLLEEDEKGKLKHDVTKLTRAINDASKMTESLKNLEDRVKKEQTEEGALRAGRVKGAFEDS